MEGRVYLGLPFPRAGSVAAWRNGSMWQAWHWHRKLAERSPLAHNEAVRVHWGELKLYTPKALSQRQLSSSLLTPTTTAQALGDQVCKHSSLWETFLMQTTMLSLCVGWSRLRTWGLEQPRWVLTETTVGIGYQPVVQPGLSKRASPLFSAGPLTVWCPNPVRQELETVAEEWEPWLSLQPHSLGQHSPWPKDRESMYYFFIRIRHVYGVGKV